MKKSLKMQTVLSLDDYFLSSKFKKNLQYICKNFTIRNKDMLFWNTTGIKNGSLILTMYKRSCPLNETVLIFSYIIIKLLQNQMPYLTEDSKPWTPKIQMCHYFWGQNCLWTKSWWGLFKGRVFAFSLSFLALISCTIIIKMI